MASPFDLKPIYIYDSSKIDRFLYLLKLGRTVTVMPKTVWPWRAKRA